MRALLQKFSLKKIGAIFFVFVVSLIIWFFVSFIASEKYDQHIENNKKIETGIERKREVGEISSHSQEISQKQEREKRTEITKMNEVTAKGSDSLSSDFSRIKNSMSKKSEKTIESEHAYYQKALHDSDSLLCDKISNKNISSQCRDDLILSASIEQELISGCEEISHISKKEQCRGMVVLKKIEKSKDYAMCTTIESPLLQKKCIEEGEKNILKNAKKKSDCEDIRTEKLKSQCTKQFLSPDDFKFSPFKCDSLPEGKEKVFCQKMTISSSLNRGKKISCSVFLGEVLEYCILKKSEISDKKLYKKALENFQYKYCSTISSQVLKEECTNTVLYKSVWEKKDIRLCTLIPDEELKEKCREIEGDRLNSFYYRQAKLDYNKSLCRKIYDSDLQERCIEFFE